MKNLLLFFVVLFPCTSFAQLLEIGINGGMIPYASYKPVNHPPVGWDLKKESASSYSYGGRVAVNFRKLQLGVAAEYQDISNRSTAEGTMSAGSFRFTNLENKIASGFLATYIYLNRGWQLPRGYLYIGISGGYALAEMSSIDIGTDNSNRPIALETVAKSKGYLGGGQAGYVMGLSRHFGISFEVACRYAKMNSEYARQGTAFNSAGYDNTLLFLPVLIGFRYQIGRDCNMY